METATRRTMIAIKITPEDVCRYLARKGFNITPVDIRLHEFGCRPSGVPARPFMPASQEDNKS